MYCSAACLNAFAAHRGAEGVWGLVVALVEKTSEAFGVTQTAFDGDGLDFQGGVFEQLLCSVETAADEFVA